MSNKKSNGFAGKGYYIALILCAAAIGISGYLYYQNANQEDAVLQETQGEDILTGTMATGDVPVLATEPQSPTQATDPTAPATQPPVKKSLKTTSPVSGETLLGYSMEALSYNETTRDWRVHNGIDIAAEEGTPVVAAADGEVYTTYEDDSMGYTVVIRHDGGYTTKYSSLSQELAVKAGDRVVMGDVIGYVGDSALVETTYGSHVHFCVTYQDQSMDPADFLELG